MLVLSRQVGKSVKISGGIKIFVLGVKGNTVRLGFEAPDDVNIVRTELVGREKPIRDLEEVFND